jgi:hypothetical protein
LQAEQVLEQVPEAGTYAAGAGAGAAADAVVAGAGAGAGAGAAGIVSALDGEHAANSGIATINIPTIAVSSFEVVLISIPP